MKRPATERINKYEKKIDSAIIGSRYDATKDLSVRSQRDYFRSAERLENEVKRIIGGVPSIQHHFYIAFAEEVVKLAKKHKGETLLSELEILQEKWKARGLAEEILNSIKTFYVQPYVPFVCEIARFDVGLFDVNCFG